MSCFEFWLILLSYGGGSFWWCAVFFLENGQFGDVVTKLKTAVVCGRVRIRGKEEEWGPLLGVTRKVYAKVMWLCGRISIRTCAVHVDVINMVHW